MYPSSASSLGNCVSEGNYTVSIGKRGVNCALCGIWINVPGLLRLNKPDH